MPKSITLTSPDGVSITLAGFRSRWMTPAPWAYCSASSTCSHEHHGARNLHRPVLDQFLEGFALEKLHHHQEVVPVAGQLVDGADPAVIQLRERHGLAAKALDRFLIDQVGVEHLDRDAAIERFVDRLVDGAHPASADLLDDAVLADGAPDHAGMIPARRSGIKTGETPDQSGDERCDERELHDDQTAATR